MSLLQVVRTALVLMADRLVVLASVLPWLALHLALLWLSLAGHHSVAVAVGG